MIRREFLSRVALAGSLAGSVPEMLWARTLSRPAPSSSPHASADEYAAPLSTRELTFIASVAEGIIPATDTEGATAAGVTPFIGFLYSDWMLAAEQAAFVRGLGELETECRTTHGRTFDTCTLEEQVALLTKWDTHAYEPRPHDAPVPFFRRLKELVVVGYYTSAIGQDVELKIRFGGGQSERDGPVMSSPPFVHI